MTQSHWLKQAITSGNENIPMVQVQSRLALVTRTTEDSPELMEDLERRRAARHLKEIAGPHLR